MRALTQRSRGDAPSVTDVEEPAAGEGEVLVRVACGSVNRVDLDVLAGGLSATNDHAWPVTLGRDLVGTVEAVGPGVAGFAAGDRVAAVVVGDLVHDGALAELVVVPVGPRVAALPEGADPVLAGALPFAGITALNAVVAARPKDGEVVLVDGATTGPGLLAVQLLAARGASVIATGAPEDEPLLRELGATEVLPADDGLVAAVRDRHPDGVVALVDLVDDRHEGFVALLEAIADHGRAVSVRNAASGHGRPDLDVANVAFEPVEGQLALLLEHLAAGRLRVEIAATHALEDAPAAIEALRAPPRGTVVVTVAAPA